MIAAKKGKDLSIDELKKHVEILGDRVQLLESLLQVTDHWVTVPKACLMLGLGRTYLYNLIQRAEDRRIAGKSVTFEYGKHYRNLGEAQAIWQVELKALQEYLKIPPERRFEG